MTPEEARAVIDGIDYDSERDMCGAFQDRYAPYTVYDMAETVANLHYEYAVQVLDEQWRTLSDAWTSEEAARSRYDATPGKKTGRVRIVRRLVSDPEVVE